MPCHHLNDFSILFILSLLSSKPFWLRGQVRGLPRLSRPHATSPASSSSDPSPPNSSFNPPNTPTTWTTPLSLASPGSLFTWTLYTSFQAHLNGLLPGAVPKMPSCLCPIRISPLVGGIPISLCKVRSLWNLHIYLSVVWASCWPELTSLQSLANADPSDLLAKLKAFPITVHFSLVYTKKHKFSSHFRKPDLLGQTWFDQERTKVTKVNTCLLHPGKGLCSVFLISWPCSWHSI